MRTLVINLDCETARLAFQVAQAARFGLDLERLAAFTPETLDPPSGSPFWTRWQRPLREVEKAVLLSHREAWRRIAAGAEPVLVLEDDAWLMPGAADLLAAAVGLDGVEYLTMETRGRRKLLGQTHPDLPSIRRLWLDRSGAAAYVLWPRGAKRLLRRAEKVAGLADAVLVEAHGLRRWQADPALAIQLDIAKRHGLMPPLEARSSISSIARPAVAGLRYRARRIWRQLVMGAIGLRRAAAERSEVRLQAAELGSAQTKGW